jgi:4-amino-4-deoxy-L-arabinose transferase-like glycosyltransferase
LNSVLANRKWILAIALLSIAGAATLLFCTSWGIGLAPDSAMYIGMARGLLAGHGCAIPVAGNRYSVVTHYLPAFPAAIALISKLGAKPLEAARLVEVIFFAANIAMAAVVIHLATQGSKAAAVVGAALMLIAPDIIWIHSFALSEALFLLLLVVAAAATARNIERPRIAELLITGILLGLCYLTRYMGIAFVAAAVMAITLLGRFPWRRRLLNAAIVGAIAAIPVLAWMLRNRRLASETVGRPMVWHPVTADHLIFGWRSLQAWLAPTSGRTLLLSTSIALVAALGAAYFVNRKKTSTPPAFQSALPMVVVIFSTVYFLFLLVAISLFDYTTKINARILSPLLGCAIVALCVLGASANHRWRVIAAAACAAIMVQWIFASSIQLSRLRHEGLGYASPLWLHSQTLRAVHRLPKETPIYTNAWDVIALLDDRPAQTLPARIVGVSGVANPTFTHDVQNLTEQVQQHAALIVFFHSLHSRESLLNESDVQTLMPLRVYLQRRDGIIYVAAGP